MFCLVDCNKFYSSCEAIFNAGVRGKPVVVLSNNDGCIISRNEEAKALGFPELVPYFQVKKQIEKQGVHVFSSNYELYGDISSRVMRALEAFAVSMEVYSIDEAFLELHCTDYKAHGKLIKDTLWQHIRMPVCVGIAPTKTLSKLANRAAKKIMKLSGVCVLDTPEKWEWLLARIPTIEIWGIGRRLSKRLSAMGINTGLELARADPKHIRRHFGVVTERTLRELNGEVCLDLELNPAPRKEIICSRSFSYKVTQLAELQQAISLYAATACEKLRRQNGLTKAIYVYMESFDRRTGNYCPFKVITLEHLTNDTRHISMAASEALAELFRPDRRYKKCGIGLLDVRTRKYEQVDFFSPVQTEKSRKLMEVMDKVNQKFGKRTLQVANAGLAPEWSMKRDFMSPCYTTRWGDVPKMV